MEGRKFWRPVNTVAHSRLGQATPSLVRLASSSPAKKQAGKEQVEKVEKVAAVPNTKTIGGLLRETIQRWEHRDALVIKHADVRYTWIELGKNVWAYADGFEGGRCLRGDRIVSTVDADSEQVLLPLAASLADVVYSPVKPTASKAELELALRALKAKLLVFPHKYRGADNIKLINDLVPELSVIEDWQTPLRSKKFPSLRFLLQVGGSYQHGVNSIDDLRWVDAAPSPLPSEQDISSNRPAVVYWHGEKAVTFSDGALVEASAKLAKHTGLSKEDRVCVAVPFHSSSFGFASGVLPSLHEAAITVIPGSFFLPDLTLKCLARDSVTRLVCLPEQLEEMLRDPSFSRHDLSKLNTIIIGMQLGSMDPPAVAQLLERTKAAFKVKNINIAYHHPLVAGTLAVSADGETAELLPGVQAKVATPGAKGELLLKGSTLTSGFWNSETNKPDDLLRDGWLKTGFSGSLRADGKLSL